MKFDEIKRMLDKKATYYWQKRDGRYALVNSFTLKTACGCNTRLDAMKLQDSLSMCGFSIAKLGDTETA